MTQSEQPDMPSSGDSAGRAPVRPGSVRRRYRLSLVEPRRALLLLIAILLLAGGGIYWGVVLPELTSADGADPDDLATRVDLSWWLSDRVRQLEEDAHFYRQRLRSLPPYSAQSQEHAGYHSAIVGSPETPQWVQIDLGREYLISEIALVPAALQGEQLIEGFAFPKRFRVQISSDPEFRASTLVADHSSSDYPEPVRYPCFVPAINLTARYVRVTVTEHGEVSSQAFFALGELIVLSGSRNVAACRPVQSSGSIENPGRWAREYLVDGHSILPPPVGVYASVTEGYRMVAREQGESAWVQLDLGGRHTIDEIRLIPARPTDVADTPGWGFPTAFRVDVATHADMSDAVPYGAYSATDGVHNRPLILPSETRQMPPVGASGSLKESTTGAYPANPIDARYVRLTVTEYDPRLKPSQFALAEFQVYSSDSNVALDATVTVSHVPTEEEDKTIWAPEYLVDEFSSRARLLEFPVWLDHLKKRRRIEQQLAETSSRLDEEVGRVWMQLGVGVGLTLMAAIGNMLWYTSWQGARMQTQTADLRNQIASDLHDDIGSNLGAIALLCQTISIRPDIPSELHGEFEEIREVALETSDSMRDIVWLMRTSTSSLTEFVGRLRGTAARMLHQCDVTFHESLERPDVMIPLNWRRSVFLSFKEVLHNAARHSKATRVRIQLDVDHDGMRILIEDDGVGFDFQTRREGGLGINSISARAIELGGHSEFRTAPDQGTTVTLELPFVHPGNIWRTLRTRIGRRWAKWIEQRSVRRPPPDLPVTRTSEANDESTQNSAHNMGRSSSIR